MNISHSKLIDDIKQIDKDIERTSFIIEMGKILEKLENEKLTQSLRNILITFVAFNQNLRENKSGTLNLGYTQG